ncbi:MAG: hypothetical protein CSYNP_02322 [Syntrophus sp. SKADARSKE-3]|nr:hypothetical protein [Syntrophus sp. SKADARSKE-3]
MDNIDKQILNLIQTDFPVVSEPFAAIAEMIGIGEAEVMARMIRMKENNVIRRIGAVFDPRKLGFSSALCAAAVSREAEVSFVEAVNSYPGVTHNYRRNDAYNIWFTVIAPTEAELGDFLAAVREKTGVTDILCMKAVRTFKINAQFEV